jgi:hypothetical protein
MKAHCKGRINEGLTEGFVLKVYKNEITSSYNVLAPNTYLDFIYFTYFQKQAF